LKDDKEILSEEALLVSDVYFKRSCAESGQVYYKPNVIPYGLFYETRSDFEIRLLWRSLCSIITRRFYGGDFDKSFKTLLRSLKYKSTALPISQMYSSHAAPTLPRIMFQTRLHHGLPDHRKHQNDQRVELVRALKNEFGDCFVGGIMNTTAARNLCPELIK